jgi:hypothetical protein
VIAAACLVVGCSEDEPSTEPDEATTTTVVVTTQASESTTTTIPEDKQAFLDAGNAICGNTNAQIDQILAQYGDAGPTNAEDTVAAIRATTEILRDTVADLRALSLPAGDEAALGAMFADLDELLVLTDQLGDALAAGDAEEIALAGDRVASGNAAANQAFAAYGLTACAR